MRNVSELVLERLPKPELWLEEKEKLEECPFHIPIYKVSNGYLLQLFNCMGLGVELEVRTLPK